MKKTFRHFAITALTACLSMTANTYSNESTNCKSPWFITGDYLYWRTSEDSLQFASLATPISNAPLFFEHRNASPKLKWESGFQAGLGYFLSPCVDASLNYTYFKTRGAGFVEATPEIGQTILILAPTINAGPLSSSLFSPNLSNASDRFKLQYNVLDFEVGNTSCLGNTIPLKFRPHLGLRAVGIKQSFDIAFTNGITNSLTNNYLQIDTSSTKTNFGAGGFRAGFDLSTAFNQCLNLFIKASGSVVCGKYTLTQIESETARGQPGAFSSPFFSGYQIFQTTNKHFYRTRTNLEGEIGFEWAKDFLCNKRLSIAVSYAIVEWFNQNLNVNQTQIGNRREADPRLIEDVNLGNSIFTFGDLGFQGLNVRLRFDF